VLVDAEIIAGDVVLISDGGGVSEAAIGEVELIRSAGGRVSTIHVEPAIVPAGMPRAERAALDAVAAAGGGVAGDALNPLPIAEEAGRGSASRLAASDLTMLLWTDFGRYLLVLALLPALALFRRRVA
jgi:Ca-activated chloride channel family protein